MRVASGQVRRRVVLVEGTGCGDGVQVVGQERVLRHHVGRHVEGKRGQVGSGGD